jgi:FkbM family methyltransferase
LKPFISLLSPGSVVLDIGANVGSHTLPIARAVGSAGRVYAFEPTRFAFQKLRKNVALNPELARHITLEQMMVTAGSAESVPAEIHSSWPIDTDEAVHAHHRGLPMDTSGAFACSVDAYCDQHGIGQVSAIKIDVDGFEIGVLRGAQGTLRRFRPPILIELEPCLYESPEHEPFEEVLRILQQSGYRLYSVADRSPLPMDEKLRHLIPDGSSMDVLGLPA